MDNMKQPICIVCSNGANKSGYCKFHRSLIDVHKLIKTDWRRCIGCDHGYSAMNALIDETKLSHFNDDPKVAEKINKRILNQRKAIGGVLKPKCKDFRKYGMHDRDSTINFIGFCEYCNGFKDYCDWGGYV